MNAPILDIRGLKVYFDTDGGALRAVDGVNLTIAAGETVAVAGESGCGKTVTALSVLKLVQMPPGYFAGGQIFWRGHDLLPLRGSEMDAIRSKEIAIVFQEPMTSLNPVYTVGYQIAEVIRHHEGASRREALQKTTEMLALVQIPDPQRRVHDYPHQFSGGMRQRVMIAMALSLKPALLIADEPATALDVTIQAQIMELLAEIKATMGMAIMLITHSMGLVAGMAERVAIMYAGKVVEEAKTADLFARPLHPYTQGLMQSIPGGTRAGKLKARLQAIPGSVPRLVAPFTGCRFAPRCSFASEPCRAGEPALREVSPGRKVACVLY